jgi:hypothetical protein
MGVRHDLRELITDRSVATLGSVSLLGEPAVDITAASSGRPLADGERVTPARTAGTIADVAVRRRRPASSSSPRCSRGCGPGKGRWGSC